MARRRPWLLRSWLLVLLLAGAGQAAPARPGEPLVLVWEGNRLTVKQRAQVPYTDALAMLVDLRKAPRVGRYALLLFRDSPRQIVGYVLAVERQGTLSLGTQLYEWDPGDLRYRFMGGELYRSYQPIEPGGEWTWFVSIRVSRELEASLVLRAPGDRWPVESVTVSVAGGPVH
jgi:hypothetical protein